MVSLLFILAKLSLLPPAPLTYISSQQKVLESWVFGQAMEVDEPLDITSLPREIILHVFAFLPAWDIMASVVQVSKLFWELAVDPILWKRFCEREHGIHSTGNGMLLNS